MGQEAVAQVQIGGDRYEAKLHLDSHFLHVSGALRTKIALIEATDWRAEAGCLCCVWRGMQVVLELGDPVAQTWLRKIQNPPSLAKKLGIADDATTSAYWQAGSAALAEFFDSTKLSNCTSSRANLCFVEVSDAPQLVAMLKLAKKLRKDQQLWVLRRKGKHAEIKESEIMNALGALGFKPNKTSAWSETFGADRYKLV
jgi:hypothetical protein